MLVLILKSNACLAVFMLFYKLFLEKESIHHFKRFYLLGALLVSIGIPFITFTQYIEVEPIQDFIPFQPLEFSNTEILIPEVKTTWQDYMPTVLWSIYLIGVLLFSFRFALNLRAIFYRIKTNPKHQYHEFTNVLIQDLIHPHTFFKYIFLNKYKYEQNLIPNEVLLHEQTHAKQKHAIDILCIEVIQIIFWFNPLLYFIKKDIKLNHEFLADQAVLQKGFDAIQYKQTLLSFSSEGNETPLVNAINYSLIKKRFTVMKSKTSKQAFWLRSLLLLPILAILIYSFSDKVIAQKNNIDSNSINQQNDSLTELYKDFYYRGTPIRVTNENGKPIYKPYEDLSNSEKSGVKTPPPLLLEKNTPNQQQLTNWRNSKTYKIFLDRFLVNNNVLNNYTYNDFSHFSVNPRIENSVTYEGQFVVFLMTYDFFKERNDARLNEFEAYKQAKKLNQKDKMVQRRIFANWGVNYNLLGHYRKTYDAYKIKLENHNKSQTKNNYIELKSLHFKLIEIYSTFTDEQITRERIFKPLPLPLNENFETHSEKNKPFRQYNQLIKDSEKLTEDEIKKFVRRPSLKEFEAQQKATPEQIAEFNKLAKKYNAQPINDRVVKLKDVKRLEYIYKLMTASQKEKAQPFPECPPPPAPPSPEVRKGEKSNIPPPPAMDTISTYNSLAKRAKLIPNNRKNNLQYIIILFNKMSDSNKEKVENPSSISKYISQLDNLTTEQAKKVNDAYNKIKARAQSKGRKFYTTAEYKELEELYASMLNNSIKVRKEEKSNKKGLQVDKTKKSTKAMDANDPNYPYVLGKYNTLATKISKQIKNNKNLKEKDVELLKKLYSKIPDKQKKQYAVDFPKLPPQPSSSPKKSNNTISKRD